jgi:Mn-dependent DtxR family transcriptional regulator
MNFSKPSVSRAVSILKGNGFINVDENGYLTLTDKGSKLANKIYERHQVLTKFFMSIGVDEKTSTDDACRIEHFISDKTFEALKKHMAK